MIGRSCLISGVDDLEGDEGGQVLRYALMGRISAWDAMRQPATFGARRQWLTRSRTARPPGPSPGCPRPPG